MAPVDGFRTDLEHEQQTLLPVTMFPSFELARDVYVLRKEKARRKYGLGMHGDARFYGHCTIGTG